MGDLLTTKVKLQSRWLVSKALMFASCLIICGALIGCSTNLSERDSKASFWEQLWLDGTDALAEGRLVDARHLLERALAEARSTGSSDMRVGITLDRLADAYAESDMTSDAEKAYLEAMDVFDKRLKEDKNEINQTIMLKEQIGTINGLTTIWLRQHKYKKAEKLLDRAVAIAKQVGCDDPEETRDKLALTEFGACLQKLGFIYENTERKEKAAKTYNKASKFLPELANKNAHGFLATSAIGATTSETGVTSGETARLNEMIRMWSPIYEEGLGKLAQGDDVAAQLSFRKAYRLARAFSDSCEPAMDSLNQLIRVTNKRRQFSDAERLFVENRTVLMEGTPTKSIDNTLGEIVKTFLRQDHWKEAEPVLLRRVEVREFLRGPSNIHVAETLSDLGSVYIELKRNKQAELVLEKAMRIVDASDKPDSELASKIALKLSTLK